MITAQRVTQLMVSCSQWNCHAIEKRVVYDGVPFSEAQWIEDIGWQVVRKHSGYQYNCPYHKEEE